MNYWWASQGKNHDVAISQQTLWSCPRSDGVLYRDRTLLKNMLQGDIVFHYSGPHLRAISVVRAEWQDAPRPAGYPRREGEGDDGWLVRVKSRVTGLQIPWQRVSTLITVGPPGPFTIKGKPHQKYISRLSAKEGLALLSESGMSPPRSEPDGGLLGLPDHFWGTGETDIEALATVRLEQAQLRKYLLRGRATAPCSICGEYLPARLLIAGHIKPRSICSEEERADFKKVAMLICSLGCDPLFEWGYIIVDSNGIVRRGLAAETKDLEGAVDLLIGKPCTAHDEDTNQKFLERTRLTHP